MDIEELADARRKRNDELALSPGRALFGDGLNPARELIVKSLLLATNRHPWKMQAEIVMGYCAPYARRDEQKIVIRFRHNKERTSYLRYSCGPGAGFFWDMSGDDFLDVGLAFRALQEAHRPPGLAWKRAEDDEQ